MNDLLQASRQLLVAKSFEEISAVVRKTTRTLYGSDGMALVLRDGEYCFYADEDAVAPLWKGQRFPLEKCLSGRSILTGEVIVSPDITQDPRIPWEYYRETFVRSLVIVPIGHAKPIGAIGAYWAKTGRPSEEVIGQVQALAEMSAVAIENISLVEKLRVANEALANSVRERDEYFLYAGHELRTPLTALKLQLQMLAKRAGKEGALSARALVSAYETLIREANRLGQVVDNVVEVSKIRLEMPPGARARTELSFALQRAVKTYSAAAARACCDVTVDCDLGTTAVCNDTALDVILCNLIANAVKYAPGTRVEISARAKGEYAEVIVQDDGPGVPAADRERIFRCFEKTGSFRKSSGLGLGLFVAQNLARAQGGNLHLDDKSDRGARFRLVLPCALDPAVPLTEERDPAEENRVLASSAQRS